MLSMSCPECFLLFLRMLQDKVKHFFLVVGVLKYYNYLPFTPENSSCTQQEPAEFYLKWDYFSHGTGKKPN